VNAGPFVTGPKAGGHPDPRGTIRMGFNHNIPYRGRMYHVQTEDSGRVKGHIFTHLFIDGVVVSTNKVEYPRNLTNECGGDRIVRVMEESHKCMMRKLCKGGFDEQLLRLGKMGPRQQPDPHPELSSQSDTDTDTSTDTDTEVDALIDRVTQLKDAINMANVNNSLSKLNTEVNGLLGAALVDHESGMCLGTIGTGIDLEVAAAGNMEVVRAKLRVMHDLGIEGGIEDILISLKSQYHIIRPVSSALFLYLAIDRKQGNLAMARHKMAAIADELEL
jgi:predicted regulator of Ras-like GTPase activity (Roadblock/LC7/MglB family)